MSHEAAPSPPQSNAFDFIRLVAALGVLFSHSFSLYGLAEPMVWQGRTLGSFCVYIFFAVSGYLICQSWLRDANLRRFMLKRALRIFPGLAVALLFTVFVLGPLATDLSPLDYFTSFATWAYLFSNLSLIGDVQHLPGVFASNPYPHAVNGSLWTLLYEVLMYFVLAILGYLGLKLRTNKIFALALLVFPMAAIALILAGKEGGWPLPLPLLWRLGLVVDGFHLANLGAYFFVGSALCLLSQQVRLNPFLALGLLGLMVVLPYGLIFKVLAWVAIPYAVIVSAYRGPALLRRMGRSDYSYGIYIYAFPVQQLVSEYTASLGLGWGVSLLCGLALTLLLAVASWHWVERPAMSFKKRLLQPMPAFAADRATSAP